MYKPIPIASALALLLALPSMAQQPAEGSLPRARALFQRVDRNSDGLINALEAGRNGIPTRDFVAHDVDRDRKLSEGEFTLFYRQLLVRSGKKVGSDLEAEAARIEAARREKAARDAERAKKAREDAARAAAARKDAQTGGSQTGGSQTGAERAEAARAEKAAQDAQRAEDARAEKAAQDAARAEAARAEKAAQDAQRAEDARAEKAAQDAARAEAARAQDSRIREARDADTAKREAERAAAARAEKAAQDAKRAEAARAAKAAQDAKRAEAARKAAQGKDKPAPKTPEARAQAYVKRLFESGRLTAPQARDFYAVLLAPLAGEGDGVDAAELRKALQRAKDRVGSLVVKGDLTSEEGRQLAAALDARAKAALPPDPEPPAPAVRRRKVDQTRAGEAGVKRASDPKVKKQPVRAKPKPKTDRKDADARKRRDG